MSMENLRFDERACFIAGAAKSGTTLLVSLLDSHPELLVIYLNNHPITLLPGSSLELASLNQILYTLRHRSRRQTKTP